MAGSYNLASNGYIGYMVQFLKLDVDSVGQTLEKEK